MNNQQFSQDDLKRLETPMQKMIHLNMKALQSFSDFTNEDWFNGKQPTNVWKRNLEVFLRNSQKGLIYLQDVFSLMEEHLNEVSSQTHRKMNNVASSTAQNSVSKSTTGAKKTSSTSPRKSTSSAKRKPTELKSASSAKKSTSTKPSTKKPALTAKSSTIAKPKSRTSTSTVKKTAKPVTSSKTSRSGSYLNASHKKPSVGNGTNPQTPSHFKPSSSNPGMKPTF